MYIDISAPVTYKQNVFVLIPLDRKGYLGYTKLPYFWL